MYLGSPKGEDPRSLLTTLIVDEDDEAGLALDDPAELGPDFGGVRLTIDRGP